jgi:hypothetical protein
VEAVDKNKNKSKYDVAFEQDVLWVEGESNTTHS